MLFAQHLMNGGHGDRSFPDCRGNAFHITGTNVANREHSGQTRFEKMRRSSKRPMSSHQIVARQVRTSFDESFRIEHDTAIEPACARNSACHYEDVPDVAGLDASALIISQTYSLEMVVPFKGDDLRLRF